LAAGIYALLKLSVIIALLVAASSVAYYYTVYLPDRDARLDQERALEQARAVGDKRAKEEQLAFQQKQTEERRAVAKAGANSASRLHASPSQSCRSNIATPSIGRPTGRPIAGCRSKWPPRLTAA